MAKEKKKLNVKPEIPLDVELTLAQAPEKKPEASE